MEKKRFIFDTSITFAILQVKIFLALYVFIALYLYDTRGFNSQSMQVLLDLATSSIFLYTILIYMIGELILDIYNRYFREQKK